jgi:glycerol uptake facilitator-like aquaporin
VSALPGLIAIAFAHGLSVMAFAFAYGPVSGGHFNPSVTIGVLAAGAMRTGEAIGYIIVQLIGGVVGALLLRRCRSFGITERGTVEKPASVSHAPLLVDQILR